MLSQGTCLGRGGAIYIHIDVHTGVGPLTCTVGREGSALQTPQTNSFTWRQVEVCMRCVSHLHLRIIVGVRTGVTPCVTRQVLAMLVAVCLRLLAAASESSLDSGHCAHPEYGIPIEVDRGQAMSGTWHRARHGRERVCPLWLHGG